MKRLPWVLLAIASIAAPAHAHDPESVARAAVLRACATASVPDAACAPASAALSIPFGALSRAGGGVSYADMRDAETHPEVVVEVGSFSFTPRILEVDLGQVVTFRNIAPAGGNTHLVASSDWLASDRALPIPGLAFGGGTTDPSGVGTDGFQSQPMRPSDRWDLVMEARHWPDSLIAPPGVAKIVIPYHCNIHGASQMSGYLILRTDEY